MEEIRKGQKGEQIARRWIEKHLKMKVLETNFRSPFGEVDLIGWDNGSFVFVEVKTRFSAFCGLPEEAVDDRKKRRIRRVAEFYLMQKGCNPDEVSIRFDVVAVQVGKGKPEVVYYKEAF
ncbi:MAG: YraN family protein [Candidatus Atribacteria bacterium]|nr:YraN family protein [Candidatus Atribacteria bacterium]